MDTFHNNDRGSVLREIDAIAASGSQDWRNHPGIAAWFEDEADLLQAMQTRWIHVLTGCLDVAIETGNGNLVQDVRDAYGRARQHHAGLWSILTENAEHPAIAAAVRREHGLLARTACVEHSSEVTERASFFVPQQRKPWFKRLLATAA